MLLSEDLTCQELVELVTEYIEGSLLPEDRDRFEQHVVLCDGCAYYLEQMRTTIDVSGSLTEEAIAPEAQEDLLRVFRDWKAG
ncbi:MAG TPA: zf-HC2 domain-containing protein [Gaiellaceae bacterium]|nr:zf-HC2 domain-containing protein [Gaiellaceae bacterium]